MTKKSTYWVSTTLLALFYLAGATYYFSDLDGVRKVFAALGYPTYLVPYIAVVKLLAAIAVVSRISVALSDLAYAGMFYHLLLAVSAHLNASGSAVPALVGLALLLVSFSTQNSARAKKSPYPAHLRGRGRNSLSINRISETNT
jgi:hypothetical protein